MNINNTSALTEQLQNTCHLQCPSCKLKLKEIIALFVFIEAISFAVLNLLTSY